MLFIAASPPGPFFCSEGVFSMCCIEVLTLMARHVLSAICEFFVSEAVSI